MVAVGPGLPIGVKRLWVLSQDVLADLELFTASVQSFEPFLKGRLIGFAFREASLEIYDVLARLSKVLLFIFRGDASGMFRLLCCRQFNCRLL